jgi:DNA-binding CsgD family transcriptional regulator
VGPFLAKLGPVFVGRDAELAEVAAALADPGLVVLAGGPGIGKSALARAAVQRAGRAPVAVGGGLATLRQVPGLPLSQAIRARLPTDDPSLAAEAVRARVAAGVLLVDDVHWADRFTLDLLPELGRTCRVLVTLRTPSPLSVGAVQQLHRAAARWLDLGPLSGEAAAALARSVFAGRGVAPTPDELAAVLNRGGGNPLAIRLLATSTEPEAGAVNTIATTLAELPQPARTALAALGLLGRPADPALLGAGVGALTSAGLVTVLPDGRVAAAVRFIAEVAAGVLPGEQRRDLHGRLADLLADDGEAAAHLAAAGDHAGAAARAVRAAENAPTLGGRAELLLLAAAHDETVRLAAAAAAADAGLDGEVVRLLSGPAPRAAVLGGMDPGVPVEDDETASRRTVLLAEALARRGESGVAAELVNAVAGRVPPSLATAHATASVLAAADPDVACALAEYAGAADPGAPPALVAAYGSALLLAGRPGWEQALGRALPAVAGADRFRLAATLVAGLREACRTDEAAEVAAGFVTECEREGAYGWEVRFRAELLWATGLRGADDAVADGSADARLREAVALLDRATPVEARTLLAATVGLAHADAGAGSAARRALRRGPGRLTTWVAAEAAWLSGGAADAGSLARSLAGTPDLAADLAAVTASWAAADADQPPPEPPGTARPAVAATLAAWRSGEFEAAARAWAGTVRREQVRCLLASGDKDALFNAEQLAEDAGLTVLLGRVRRALRVLGIVRKPPEQTVSGLSPREYEVLRLVGQGLPTHRIAELIGISRHTAEGYIKQAMGKLGARTRTEAAVQAAILAAAE